MPFRHRNRAILAKIESTYGTDPTPEGASDFVLTKGLSRQIYEGNRVNRDLDLPYMGGDEQINTAPFVTLSFSVEMAGSATAGTAPSYGCLLRACGLSETVIASTSVTYAPVSSSFESVTIYYNYDGELQKITGARGSVSLSMSRGGLPVYNFTFTGKYAKPTTVAMFDPTRTDQAPLPFNNVNTTTFSVHSQAVNGESFNLDLGMSVVHRNLAGYDGVDITDRNATGNVVFEAPAIATKDFYEAAESHDGTLTKAAISIVHGPAAGDGRNIAISVPTAQLQNINEQEIDGIKFYDMPFGAIPSESGNDELSIAYS